MTDPIEYLNSLSIVETRRYFGQLSPPEPGSMQGIFRGIFVGPRWLTRLWGPVLALTGLGGWWGKEIEADGNAINLVLRAGQFERSFPMFMVDQRSHVGGEPGRAFRYREDNPLPWPLIVDELRRIDEDHVLGMTLAEVGLLRRQAFPFVLQSRGSLYE
jgi:hypothetical protein